MFVFLQSEINRGIVQFRRPQFGDDLSSEPACDFFFFYAVMAVIQYCIFSPDRLIPTIILTVPMPTNSQCISCIWEKIS